MRKSSMIDMGCGQLIALFTYQSTYWPYPEIRETEYYVEVAEK